MKSVKDEVRANLLFYRKKANMTQQNLANILGVGKSAISQWENGGNSIDIDTLTRICDIFNVSVNDMFGIYSNVQAEQLLPFEKLIINHFRSLNQEGQDKVVEYITDLLSIDKYIKVKPVMNNIEVANDLSNIAEQTIADDVKKIC